MMDAYITSTEQGTYNVRQSGTQKLLQSGFSNYKAAARWAKAHKYQVMGVCMLEWED